MKIVLCRGDPTRRNVPTLYNCRWQYSIFTGSESPYSQPSAIQSTHPTHTTSPAFPIPSCPIRLCNLPSIRLCQVQKIYTISPPSPSSPHRHLTISPPSSAAYTQHQLYARLLPLRQRPFVASYVTVEPVPLLSVGVALCPAPGAAAAAAPLPSVAAGLFFCLRCRGKGYASSSSCTSHAISQHCFLRTMIDGAPGIRLTSSGSFHAM